MYSEQLEQLIQSVIADGVVTEKERAVLHKKAAAEGVDADEIDVYVDGLLTNVEPKEKALKQYNRAVFDKINLNNATYYQFQKYYKVPVKFPQIIDDIYIFLADVVDCRSWTLEENKHKNAEHLEMHMLIGFNHSGYKWYDSDYDLIITTNIGTLTLVNNNHIVYFANPVVSGKTCNSCFDRRIDAEQLKMLADSQSFKLSLGELEFKPLKENGRADYDAPSEYVEVKELNCRGLQSYFQCFYREVVDNTAYPNAEIKDAPDVDDQEQGILETYSSKTPEAQHAFEPEVAAGLLSMATKKLRKTAINTSLIKQYTGMNDIVVTHISGKKEIDESDQYPVLRLHALTHPKVGTKFYFGLITKSFESTLGLVIRANMKDYVLDPVVTEERLLEKGYVEDEDEHFNFFEVDKALLEKILTIKTGVTFYKGGDTSKKGLKVEKLPKSWLKAFELLKDEKTFEQWKQTETENKAAHPILYFCRSHIKLIIFAVIALLVWLFLF